MGVVTQPGFPEFADPITTTTTKAEDMAYIMYKWGPEFESSDTCKARHSSRQASVILVFLQQDERWRQMIPGSPWANKSGICSDKHKETLSQNKVEGIDLIPKVFLLTCTHTHEHRAT